MRVQRFVSGLSCSSSEWETHCMTVVALAAKLAKVLRTMAHPQHMATDPLYVKLRNILYIYTNTACAKIREWTHLFKL